MAKAKMAEVATRERILNKALELIHSNPDWRISVSDLKSETGISTGSFYHFFPKGAEDIAETLFFAVTKEVKIAILLRTEKSRTLSAFIQCCVDNFIDWHLDNEKKSVYLNRTGDLGFDFSGSEKLQTVHKEFLYKFRVRFEELVAHEFPDARFNFEILVPLFFGSVQEYIRSWNRRNRPVKEVKLAKKQIALFLYNGLRN